MTTERFIGYIVLGFIFVFISINLLFLDAPKDFPEGAIIEVKKGESLSSVAEKLEEENIIRSGFAFKAFVILYGGERHIESTYYFFENKISVFEAAKRMSTGDSRLKQIRITIPEGFTKEEISKLFVKFPNFNEVNFLATAKEGYLFPDTYFFFVTANENDVIKITSDNYERKITPLRAEIPLSGRSEKDIITMASIIEREAKGDTDRAIISGILWRRYSIGMALQADAAPETYDHAGLPASPIANPGLKSIRASIKPETSPYLYYLHDKTGAIHYARSYDEHLSNINTYLR